MADKRFQGVLDGSIAGTLSSGLVMTVHVSTTGNVIEGTRSTFRIDETGAYDFRIKYGNVAISTQMNTGKIVHHGTMTIDSGTAATTLPALLNATTPPSDPLLLQLQALLQDAQDAANSANQAIAQIEESNFNAQLASLVNISGGKWQVLKDNFGNAQVVRRVPAHTFETLNIAGCPFAGPLDCFIRQDGSLRPYVDVPVYLASNKGGKAVSQADKDPWTSINADTARARCAELNANSMVMSQEIWAMICWNIISQGYQPRGNTEFGRSHSNINEFGRRTDGRVPNDRAGSALTLTGSGPEAWRHDGTDFGVADMVGNAWEWVDGMKMVNGQFIVAEYTGQPEGEWVASGAYISETGQFTNVAPVTLNLASQTWGNIPKAPGYAGNEKLQRLIIEPIECTKHLSGRFYWNLDGERFPRRGGSWNGASDAGPAALGCDHPRSLERSNLGFRAAFVS